MHHQDFTRSFDFHYLISRKKWTDSVLQRIDCVKIADFLLKREKKHIIRNSFLLDFLLYAHYRDPPVFSLSPSIWNKNFPTNFESCGEQCPTVAEFFTISKRVATNLVYKIFLFFPTLVIEKLSMNAVDDGEREREGDRITGNKRKSDEEGNKIENKEKKRGREKGG